MNRIKELRKRKGLTLDDVSERTGINRATLNRYENGKSEPKLNTWVDLATFFGVTVSYLQGITPHGNAREIHTNNAVLRYMSSTDDKDEIVKAWLGTTIALYGNARSHDSGLFKTNFVDIYNDLFNILAMIDNAVRYNRTDADDVFDKSIELFKKSMGDLKRQTQFTFIPGGYLSDFTDKNGKINIKRLEKWGVDINLIKDETGKIDISLFNDDDQPSDN